MLRIKNESVAALTGTAINPNSDSKNQTISKRITQANF